MTGPVERMLKLHMRNRTLRADGLRGAGLPVRTESLEPQAGGYDNPLSFPSSATSIFRAFGFLVIRGT